MFEKVLGFPLQHILILVSGKFPVFQTNPHIFHVRLPE